MKTDDIYVKRILEKVVVLNSEAEEFDSEGNKTYAGFVAYTNHVGARCVKTVEQFNSDYLFYEV
jgi:hypothetical protein